MKNRSGAQQLPPTGSKHHKLEHTPHSILYKSTQCLVGGLLEALDLEHTPHSILCTVLGSLEALNLVAEPYFGRSDHRRAVANHQFA